MAAAHAHTDDARYQRFVHFDNMMSSAYHTVPHTRFLNPTPLGLCAFAYSLFILGMYYCWATVPIGTNPNVAMGAALFYGGLVQLLAGLLEFRNGHNFRALFFCSYAAYFASLAALYMLTFSFLGAGNPAVIAGPIATATTIDATWSPFLNSMGVFYLGWLIFTLAMFIASLKTDLPFVLTLFFLMLYYLMLVAGFYTGGTATLYNMDLFAYHNLLRAGGAFGITSAVVAWYAAFGSLLTHENSYFVLPNFTLNRWGANRGTTKGGPVEVTGMSGSGAL